MLTQDYIIYFLLKNNIPFVADIHYGDETWGYFKDSSVVFTTENFNKKLQFRTEKEIRDIMCNVVTPIKIIYVKDWLKNQER